MLSLSVVVPAFNESATLEKVVERIMEIVRKHGIDTEVIILNDASTDQTEQVAFSLQQRYPREVRYYSHRENMGIFRTFEDLFSLSTKEFVVEIPGDGQIDPAVIDQMLPLLVQYDIVLCRRRRSTIPRYRNLLSRAYVFFPRLLFGVDLIDPGCAKCRKRDVINLPTISRSVFIEAERLLHAYVRGYRIGSIDIEVRNRMQGKGGGGKLSVLLPALRDMLKVWYNFGRFSKRTRSIIES